VSTLEAEELVRLGKPLVRWDRGVMLRYHPQAVPPGRNDLRRRVTDEERKTILKAESALLKLRVIAGCSDFPEFVLNRIYRELDAVQFALEVTRPVMGMERVEAME
jgi:hypothetical protein